MKTQEPRCLWAHRLTEMVDTGQETKSALPRTEQAWQDSPNPVFLRSGRFRAAELLQNLLLFQSHSTLPHRNSTLMAWTGINHLVPNCVLEQHAF